MPTSVRTFAPAVAAPRRAKAGSSARRGASIVVAAAVATKTVKIGTRGSPLALAQAYMTRDLLKVRLVLGVENKSSREAAEREDKKANSQRISAFVKPSLSLSRPRLRKTLSYPSFFLNPDLQTKNLNTRQQRNPPRPPSRISQRTAPSRSASSRPPGTRSWVNLWRTSEAKGSSRKKSTMRCSMAGSTSPSTL